MRGGEQNHAYDGERAAVGILQYALPGFKIAPRKHSITNVHEPVKMQKAGHKPRQSAKNQCVDSLIRQSLAGIEILLIDDGSTDRSGELCDELAGTDLRISVYHKENEGQGIARNMPHAIKKP